MDTPSLPSPTVQAAKLREIGISEAYASQIANRKRPPSDALAVRIWRETGLKYGLIEGAEDTEIEALGRLLARQSA